MSNNTSPLFSIIVPVYNVETFIHKALSSVLEQNFDQYELIVINDGSTDKSGDICREFARKYPQIFLVETPNSGLSTARNIGLNIAKGKYILFLDSDDYWDGENILRDLAHLIEEKDEPDVILHSYQFINLKDPSEKPQARIINRDNLSGNYKYDFNTLLSNGIYHAIVWTKIVRRELISQKNLFFPIGKLHEDVDWSFRLAKYIQRYAIYDNAFYVYQTCRTGSITEKIKTKNVKDLLSILLFQLNELSEIKEFYPYLFEGLFSLIRSDLIATTRYFMSLPSKDQQGLGKYLIECYKLCEKYTQL